MARRRKAPPQLGRIILLAICGILTIVVTPGYLNVVTPLLPEHLVRQHRAWVVSIFAAVATITVLVWVLISRREAETGARPRGRRDSDGRDVDVSLSGSDVQAGESPVDNIQVQLETRPPARPHVEARPFRIWNLPTRNQAFTGRHELLEELHRRLTSGQMAVLHGLGGVGKSQVALEYAHRHRRTYDLIWWVQADTALATTTTLAALAPLLGLPVDADQSWTCRAVLQELTQRDDWLLIFDDVQGPESLPPFLADGDGGHVLITSRHPSLGSRASRIEVREFLHDEAVEFLLASTGSDDRAAAETITQELGGLALALAQVVAYIDQVPGVDLAGYLERHRRSPQLLESGRPSGYQGTVLTTWQLNLHEVCRSNLAAAQLLELSAFFAPGVTIPRELLTAEPTFLPEPLRSVCRSDMELDRAIAQLYRYSLVSRSERGFSVHRMVQRVTRGQLAEAQTHHWAERAIGLMHAAFPAEPIHPAAWARATVLLPHALAASEHPAGERVAPAATAALADLIGLFLDSRGALTDAREHLERALRIKETLYGPDTPEVAVALTNLGIVLVKSAAPLSARRLLERALEIKLACYGPEHPEVAMTQTHLGNALRKLGDLPAALSAQKQALRLFKQAYGRHDERVANILTNLGIALNKDGRPRAARDRLEQAVRIKEAHFGPNHPEVAIPLTNLGNAHRKLGELDEAQRFLSRALLIEQAAYGDEHPWVAYTLANLGETLRELGDLANARAVQEQALRIKQTAFGASHQEVGVTLTRLAKVLYDQGDLVAASETFQRALRIFTGWLDDLWAASVRTHLGRVLRDLGELETAYQLQRSALRTFQRIYRRGHPQIAITLTNLGEVQRDLGETAAATECFKRALAILRGSLGLEHLATIRAERLLREPPEPTAA